MEGLQFVTVDLAAAGEHAGRGSCQSARQVDRFGPLLTHDGRQFGRVKIADSHDVYLGHDQHEFATDRAVAQVNDFYELTAKVGGPDRVQLASA